MAIARAVYFGAKVLILDEPTSALGVKQSGVVLRYIAQARDRGLGVIFITHNPHHAYPVGDRFVILNRGRLMGTWHKGEITRDELVKQMSGGAELDALEHELERRRSVTRIGVGRDRLRLARARRTAARCCASRRCSPERDVRRRAGASAPTRCPSARERGGRGRSASRAATEDWRAVIDDPDGRRRLRRRAEHAPRRARRGGRARRASTCSARSRSAARPSRRCAPSRRRPRA